MSENKREIIQDFEPSVGVEETAESQIEVEPS
jgi:hypothetical protein